MYIINDELIWVSIPRCASFSIDVALQNSKLDIKSTKYYYDNFGEGEHAHIRLDTLYKEFGFKETVCIKRDWFSKWVSGINYVHSRFKLKNDKKLTNDIIYEIYNEKLISYFYGGTSEDVREHLSKWFHIESERWSPNGYLATAPIEEIFYAISVSQNFWKCNKPCTYEFDISEIDKFKEFIKNRFGEELNIEHHNSSFKSDLVLDDKLRNFIWNHFEAPFVKRNSLI